MTDFAYMLDTNIVSDMVRNPKGAVARMIRRVGVGSVCVSAIVASELRYGVRKKGSPRLEDLVEELLARLPVVDFDDQASRAYGAIRLDLERRGMQIGATDLFIAAHAVASGQVLVTANLGEFSRVSGLKLENWLETE